LYTFPFWFALLAPVGISALFSFAIADIHSLDYPTLPIDSSAIVLLIAIRYASLCLRF